MLMASRFAGEQCMCVVRLLNVYDIPALSEMSLDMGDSTYHAACHRLHSKALFTSLVPRPPPRFYLAAVEKIFSTATR